MDAVAMLKADHQKVKGLFREFEAAGDRAYQTKERIVLQVISEIEAHSILEEEIFYPAVKDKANKELRDVVVEGVEEHAVVKRLMEELKSLAPQAENYSPKFKVLMENVEHHIQEEEEDMLPQAEEILGAEAEALADRMMARKQELLRRREAA